jgi:hypothetical protein
MAITHSGGVITISGEATTPVGLWNASQAGGWGAVTRVGLSKYWYDMGTTRVVVANGGTLTVDTTAAVGALVFGDRPDATNAIRIQSGGTLITGTASTVGRVIDFTQPLANDSHTFNADWVAIRADAGGVWNWPGGEIQSHHSVRHVGTGTISGNAAFVNEGKQAAPNGSEIVFQADSTSLSLAKLRIYRGLLSTFKVPNTLTSVSFESCASCTVGIGLANTFIVFTGFNVADPSNDRGHVLWDNRWAKFVNHATGTDFVVAGNLPDHTNNKGLCEVRQGVTFAATSGSGAKFYTKDTNNGSRLAANQLANNPNYQTDRAYTLTESTGAASYTTDGGVLTGVHWRTIGGLEEDNNEFDSRGITNDTADIFTWLKVEYGQQPATSNIIMKGTSAVTAEIQSLPDQGITESTKSTVAAYTGIAPVYSGGTLTVTVTQDHTWNEVYDFIKWWESENPASVWDNGQTAFVSTIDRRGYTYTNMTLVLDAAALILGEGQSLPEAPTLVNQLLHPGPLPMTVIYLGVTRGQMAVKEGVPVWRLDTTQALIGDVGTEPTIVNKEDLWA